MSFLRRKKPEEEQIVRDGDSNDIAYVRDVLTGIDIEHILGTVNEFYQGGVVYIDRVRKMSLEETLTRLALLLRKQPDEVSGTWGRAERYSDVDFNHYRRDGMHGMHIIFRNEWRSMGMFGVRRNGRHKYEILLEGILWKDKLADVSQAIPSDLKETVDDAVKQYTETCYSNGMLPHISKVHSFTDTVQQAYVLAMMGKNNEEQYNLAVLTFYSHLFDDFIDPLKNLRKVLRDFKGKYEDAQQYLPDRARHVAQQMVDLASGQKQELVKRTIVKVIYGALIQQSWTKGKQRKYAEEYQTFVAEGISNAELKAEVQRLHPMQVWLTTHTAMDMVFAMEDDFTQPDIAELYSLFYAPMLYCHDRAEELKKENFKIRFGRKELCMKDGYIADEHLIYLIDIFDRHIGNYHDSRKQQRLKQMQTVYTAFESVLSESLRQRYLQTLTMAA